MTNITKAVALGATFTKKVRENCNEASNAFPLGRRMKVAILTCPGSRRTGLTHHAQKRN